MGCDLNSKSVAFCILDPELTKPRWVKHTVKVGDRARMLGELYDFTHGLLVGHERVKVYIESPVLAGVRNIQSTIKVAAAYGAVLAAVNAARCVAIETPVSSWKLATVGRGNASKLDVSVWLHSQHPDHHRECGSDQDLMDATCIALFGHQKERAVSGGRGVLHQAAVEEHPRYRHHGD